MTSAKPGIQLYDRDAAVVSALLTLVADDIPKNDPVLDTLAASLPGEVCFGSSAQQRHLQSEDRLRSIAATIAEQRGDQIEGTPAV